MSGIWREVGKAITRSPGWIEARRNHLKQFPTCAACGKSKLVGLQVHHKKPFHLFPELELDPDNLITLCDDPQCHLLIGHLDYFKSYNPNVVEDAALWLKRRKERP